MIRRLEAPVAPRARVERTPGRYEGLYHFAVKIGHVVGLDLKTACVLDVGGSDGWLGDFLVCGRYWALDLWQSPHVVGDAHALPIRTASVDVVVAKQVLPHWADPPQACRELLRAARGWVILRQEFPYGGPIGWPGHSRVAIDHYTDVLAALAQPGWAVQYDGTDFIARREEEGV